MEDPTTARQASEALDALVTHMHPTDQDFFELCLLRGFTYKEAARNLGLTHAQYVIVCRDSGNISGQDSSRTKETDHNDATASPG